MNPRIDAALEALVNRGIQKVAWKPYQPAGAPPRPPRPPSPVYPGGGRVGQGGAPFQPRLWASGAGAAPMTAPRAGGPPASPQQGMAAAAQRFNGNGAMPQPQSQYTPPRPPQQPQRATVAAPPQSFGGQGPGWATSTPRGVPTAREHAAVARDAALRLPAPVAPPKTAPRDLSNLNINLNTTSDAEMRAWLRSQGLI